MLNFYIETFGCQMNEKDSDLMDQLMRESNFLPTADIGAADILIINTCSIRAKAEQKVYSLLGSLRHRKREDSRFRIAVTGCLAQQEGRKMIARMPHVDVVIGPQSIYDLPRLLKEAEKNRRSVTATDLSTDFTIPSVLPDLKNGSPHKRFVTIMQGCNNYCTYCIVPYTRGRESSRQVEDIMKEARHLVELGVKEITLLGQNVNSYGNDQPVANRTSFPELLRQVARIEGLRRLRFTTSNPKDLSPALMTCFKDLDNLCSHFHLPVQSGSDKILQKMNRKYTVESYLDKVAGLREARSGLALTTDLIVGFPGETEKDFQKTMDLLQSVQFHSAFSFKYSSRPPARSCSFQDDIGEEEKSRRLSILQERQKEITLKRNQEYVGSIMNVMVEGPSRSSDETSGRTDSNHIVNFPCPRKLEPGEIIPVKITRACFNTLRGEILFESDPTRLDLARHASMA